MCNEIRGASIQIVIQYKHIYLILHAYFDNFKCYSYMTLLLITSQSNDVAMHLCILQNLDKRAKMALYRSPDY